MAWEVKKLGEVCGFQNGFAFKSKDFTDRGIPVIRITNIQNEEIDESSLVYINIPESKNKLSSFEVYPGDLLIAMSGGTTGKIGFNKTNKTFYLNQRVGKFVPTAKLNLKYLYYFLSTKVEESLKISAGSAQPNLSTEQINNFLIPLPPLEIQKKIVEVLDSAFEKIAKAKENSEQNLQNAKDVFESYLQNVFENKGDGWEETDLGKIGEITSSKRIYKHEYVQNGIPFYRTKELKELAHGKEISLELYIDEKKYFEIKNKYGIPMIGDILISAVGTIGEILVISNDNKFYFKDGNIIWFKNINHNVPDYIKYSLIAFVEKINNLAKGAAYNALTIEKLKCYKIPLPQLEVQKIIVSKLDNLSEQTKQLESIYSRKLDCLEELKQSILQKAFKGELTEALS